MTGVYILKLDGSPVYVGCTKRWPTRKKEHPKISFDSAEFIECPYNVMRELEKETIKKLCPKENRQHNQTKHRPRISDSWILANFDEIKRLRRKRYISEEFIEIVRTEFGHSIRTTSIDIWSTIDRKYERLKFKGK